MCQFTLYVYLPPILGYTDSLYDTPIEHFAEK